jgi:hypothetical protein
MRAFPGYEMDRKELDQFVADCQQRGLSFDTVEFTGGEPLLWEHLEYACELLTSTGVARSLLLITNGTNPLRMAAVLNYFDRYVVSQSHCLPADLLIHQQLGKAIYNTHQHKPLPQMPHLGVLPAQCCTARDLIGRKTNVVVYLCGRVWYCCLAFANQQRTQLDEGLSVAWQDYRPETFQDKRYDKLICTVCVCNEKVWGRLP